MREQVSARIQGIFAYCSNTPRAPAGAAAEILSGYDKIARPHLLGELLHTRIVFKSILRHFGGIGFRQIFVVIDKVGIHVVANTQARPFKTLICCTSLNQECRGDR